MAFGELLESMAGSGIRLVATILGKAPPQRDKHLQSRIVMRGVVAELPLDFVFNIMDPSGRAHRGVYALNVLIWNRGCKEISPADFVENAPLRLAVSEGSYIVMADIMSNDDQLVCSTFQSHERIVDVHFDCINPGDYLNVILYYGGEARADVDILGRVRGQDTSLDHKAEEVKASFGERLAHLVFLLWAVDMVLGVPISAWIIYKNYNFMDLFHTPPTIPQPILVPFAMGLSLASMLIISGIGRWWERRKYPPGYPLRSDLEPPLMENLKGLFQTVLTGKKIRLSTSLFNWGQPVIMTRKRNKRRSVDDWIA